MSAIACWRDMACIRRSWAGEYGERKTTTDRRRDKRGSPDEPQAIGMAWVPACWSVGTRAVVGDFTKDLSDVFGTASRGRKEEPRP